MATLNLSHRYYTQGQARFYQPRYLDPMQKLDYVTRDRELSAMYSQRVGLGIERAFELGEEGNTVLCGAAYRRHALSLSGLRGSRERDGLRGNVLAEPGFPLSSSAPTHGQRRPEK